MKPSLFTTSLTTRKIIIGIVTTLILIGGGAFAYSYLQNQPEEVQDEGQEVVCEPNFECDEWSECIEGKQVRECTDSNTCNGSESREETRECEVTESEESTPVESEEPLDETPDQYEQTWVEPPAQDPPAVAPRPQIGPFDIEITGTPACQQNVRDALNLLETKAPSYYQDVRTYVGKIDCVEGSNSFVLSKSNIPWIRIGATTNTGFSLEKIASIIVHEMMHIKLHIDYIYANNPSDGRAPTCVSSGLDVEIQIAREYEIPALQQLGASQADIDEVYRFIENAPNLYQVEEC
jgi:hypothetical protein